MCVLPKLEPNYLVKMELEVEAVVLSTKENKRKKGDLGEKLSSFFSDINCLAPFLNLKLTLERVPSQ